jgi:hypothetical protein
MPRGRSRSLVLKNIPITDVYQKLLHVPWTDSQMLCTHVQNLHLNFFYCPRFDTIKILSRAIVHTINTSISTRGIRNPDIFWARKTGAQK